MRFELRIQAEDHKATGLDPEILMFQIAKCLHQQSRGDGEDKA
jgi:hypothetical protein